MDPQPGCVAQIERRAQHAVVGDEEWHLDGQRQASADWADAFLFHQLADFRVHLLPPRITHTVLLVFLLDRVHLRLDLLHLESRLHAGDAQWHQRQIDDQSLQANRPAPVPNNAFDPAEPDEEGTRNHAPETKVDKPAQVWVRTYDGGHRHGLQSRQRFWSYIHSRNRRTFGVADSCSEHVHGRRILRVRVFRILGNVERVAQSDQGGVLRIVRNEDGSE